MQQQGQPSGDGQANYAKEWAEYYARMGYTGYEQQAAVAAAAAQPAAPQQQHSPAPGPDPRQYPAYQGYGYGGNHFLL